jgi:hypothetical protein
VSTPLVRTVRDQPVEIASLLSRQGKRIHVSRRTKPQSQQFLLPLTHDRWALSRLHSEEHPAPRICSSTLWSGRFRLYRRISLV